MGYSAACNCESSINTELGQERWLFEDPHMVKTEEPVSVNRGHGFNFYDSMIGPRPTEQVNI